MENLPRMISLKEAASETGLSYYCLRNLCLANKIVHIISGNKFLVNADKLAAYLNNEETDEEKDAKT